MREILQVLARKIARIIRIALNSKSAMASDSDKLESLLSPVTRIWTLAVILASWQLSKDPQRRGELNRLLRGSGVPSLWPTIDFVKAKLDPFVLAARDANTNEEEIEASLRFLDGAKSIGLPLLTQLVNSNAFKGAQRAILRDVPEEEVIVIKQENQVKTAKPQREWTKADSELEDLATDYLTLVGWTRPEVESYLSGKK